MIQTDKLKFFGELITIFNKSHLNIAIEAALTKQPLVLDTMHPAVRAMPLTEKAYNRRFVQLVMRKSTSNVYLSHALIEEFFVSIIGKNCLDKIIQMVKQPKFLYYMICLLCDKKRTRSELSTKNGDQAQEDDEQTDLDPTDKPVDTISETEPSDAFEEPVTSSNNMDEQTGDKSDHNLYQEFNDRNLNSFKSFTYSSSSSLMNGQIVSLEVASAETNYELKTGKQYTSYIIKIEYLDRSSNKAAQPNSKAVYTRVLKRRFKEFVALQKKLEENHLYQSFLKSIKGPSKFINLSIGNMEELVIEKRRKKLNEYLKKLIRIPQLVNSQELCLFLGNYNKDFFLVFDKNSPSSGMPSNHNPINKDSVLVFICYGPSFNLDSKTRFYYSDFEENVQ